MTAWQTVSCWTSADAMQSPVPAQDLADAHERGLISQPEEEAPLDAPDQAPGMQPPGSCDADDLQSHGVWLPIDSCCISMPGCCSCLGRVRRMPQSASISTCLRSRGGGRLAGLGRGAAAPATA